MIRRLMVRVLAFTVLVPCMSTLTFGMTGPDPNRLTMLTFDISGLKILLPVPSSRATKDLDGVRKPILGVVDLTSPHQAPIQLLDDMWDWRSLLHLYGSIRISVFIHSAPDWVNPTCSGSLRKMLANKFKARRRKSISLGGKKDFLPQYSLRPSLVTVSDHASLAYEIGSDYDFSKRMFGEDDSQYYIIPVDAHSYLEIGFNVFGGGDPRVKRSDWAPKAEAVKNKVLHGVRLEGSWPKLQDCPAS